ncbi:hypothetical protein AB0K48_01405 [Nonomuraea sp. NPDC055795]
MQIVGHIGDGACLRAVGPAGAGSVIGDQGGQFGQLGFQFRSPSAAKALPRAAAVENQGGAAASDLRA